MMTNDTIYNSSDDCKICGSLVNPVEKLFAINDNLCPDCRHVEAGKRVKRAMA
jgi:hypothetical protein